MINMLRVAIFAGLFIALAGSIQQTVPPKATAAAKKVAKVAKRPAACWTQWFDRDNPSGTGDWEDINSLRKANPGKICRRPLAIQAQTTNGQSVASTGNKIFKNNINSGFVCRNRDQPKGKRCRDFRVRFRCPPSHCVIKACWTKWFDRDNPSGTGDWEHLTDLRKENPGKICRRPLAIQAQTTNGQSVASTGNTIFKNNVITGFVCRNQDQRKGKRCRDFRVRFRCPPCHCEIKVCWTKWFDRDNPSGTGDWEHLTNLRKENPGKICRRPLAIQAQTLTGLSVAAAGNRIFKNDINSGFVCRNQDQRRGKRCLDYRVRFRCPPSHCEIKVCWTKWLDIDNPSGTGDWEDINSLRKANPGKICRRPLAIQAVTTDTNTPATSTGNIIFFSSPTKGFACRNKDQSCGQCRDYKVRFRCPC